MGSKFDGQIEPGIYYRYKRNRDGSIRKGRNGKPLRTFTHRYRDANGKTCQDTYETLDEARNEGKQDTRASVDNGTHIEKDKGTTTLGAYAADTWLPGVWASKAAGTARNYDHRWKRISTCGAKPIADIPFRALSREDIQRAFNAYAPGLKASTVRTTWTTLRQILKRAVLDGYTQLDPRCIELDLARSIDDASKRQPIPTDDYWTLRDEIETRSPGMGDFLDIGAGLGLRDAEARALDVNKIDFETGTYLVDTQLKGTVRDNMWLAPPKSGRARTVPIPTRILERIKERVTENPPTERTMTYHPRTGKAETVTVRLLFVQPDNTPMRYEYPNRLFRTARRAVGLPETITYHSARHTYASHLIEGGESITTIAARMGHANPRVTLTYYAHLMKNDHAKTVAILDKAMTRQPTRTDTQTA